MRMASRVPGTRRSRSESAIWAYDGLTTNWPSIRPTRTAPTGPSCGGAPKGMSAMVSAAEAATMASTAGWGTWAPAAGPPRRGGGGRAEGDVGDGQRSRGGHDGQHVGLGHLVYRQGGDDDL